MLALRNRHKVSAVRTARIVTTSLLMGMNASLSVRDPWTSPAAVLLVSSMTAAMTSGWVLRPRRPAGREEPAILRCISARWRQTLLTVEDDRRTDQPVRRTVCDRDRGARFRCFENDSRSRLVLDEHGFGHHGTAPLTGERGDGASDAREDADRARSIRQDRDPRTKCSRIWNSPGTRSSGALRPSRRRVTRHCRWDQCDGRIGFMCLPCFRLLMTMCVAFSPITCSVST